VKSAYFFQAEDGIRDFHVTGVQTCALPMSLIVTFMIICTAVRNILERQIGEKSSRDLQYGIIRKIRELGFSYFEKNSSGEILSKIGRASCRERVEYLVMQPRVQYVQRYLVY